jgi:hypothetical protein
MSVPTTRTACKLITRAVSIVTPDGYLNGHAASFEFDLFE